MFTTMNIFCTARRDVQTECAYIQKLRDGVNGCYVVCLLLAWIALGLTHTPASTMSTNLLMFASCQHLRQVEVCGSLGGRAWIAKACIQ